jgi:hypothetical protein
MSSAARLEGARIRPLEKANSGLRVVLVLRRSRRAVDRMAQGVGAEPGCQLVHSRQDRLPGRELLLVPVCVDQDDVRRNSLARHCPQGRACDGSPRLQSEQTPIGSRALLLEERLGIVLELLLVRGVCGGGQKRVQRLFLDGEERDRAAQNNAISGVGRLGTVVDRSAQPGGMFWFRRKRFVGS